MLGGVVELTAGHPVEGVAFLCQRQVREKPWEVAHFSTA
jgi:hypothetical protein